MKIGSKLKALPWRHRFPHYKSMRTFCCHRNHSFDGIFSKTKKQPFSHPTDDSYKIWSRLVIWSLRFHNKSIENLIRPQGRVTPKWLIRSGLNSNASEILCLSWWFPVISYPGHFVPKSFRTYFGHFAPTFCHFVPNNNHFVPRSFRTQFSHFVPMSNGYEMTICWSIRTQVISYPSHFVPISVISYPVQIR